MVSLVIHARCPYADLHTRHVVKAGIRPRMRDMRSTFHCVSLESRTRRKVQEYRDMPNLRKSALLLSAPGLLTNTDTAIDQERLPNLHIRPRVCSTGPSPRHCTGGEERSANKRDQSRMVRSKCREKGMFASSGLRSCHLTDRLR